MPVTVLVGCQWGDEGKGKIVDVLSAQMSVVARYQGGNNAGHTVVIHGDKYVLHTLPSGILHDGVMNVIGNGVVVDVRGLVTEIGELESNGLKVDGNLLISEQAHIILPQHAALDRARETSLGSDKIGTTGKGIGSAYAQKMARRGIRACDFKRRDVFVAKYREFATYTNDILTKYFGVSELNAESMLEELLSCGERIRPMIADTVTYMNDAIADQKQILAEGAQGVLLDVDFGTYPFVTSSSPSPGGACTGLGISPRHVTSILGIVKAYTTRVGSGPMPTELLDETGERLRQEGGEFGATTGRPRRCGWFDAPATRRALQISGCTEIVITKLDVLSIFDEIKICTAYDTADGRTNLIPFDPETLKTAKPVYETMPGWSAELTEARTIKDLPEKARNYIDRLQEILGVSINMVSVGADRKQTIKV
ncbi:adenylosuccinate synthase [soil metagenome]